MPNLGKATREAAEHFEALTGIHVEMDLRDLILPGAWIMPQEIRYDRLDKTTATGVWEVNLIAGPTVDLMDALDEISTMAAKVNDAGLGDGKFETASVTIMNHSPDPIPAMTFTLELEVTD